MRLDDLSPVGLRFLMAWAMLFRRVVAERFNQRIGYHGPDYERPRSPGARRADEEDSSDDGGI